MPVFAAGCCILVCWLALAARAIGLIVLRGEGRVRGAHWFSYVCGSHGKGLLKVPGGTCKHAAAIWRHNKCCFPLRRVCRDWFFFSCTCLGLERQCCLPLHLLFSCLLVMLLQFESTRIAFVGPN